MKMNMNSIAVDDTRFIFQTNFSGDPNRDRFADSRRKGNIVIPDPGTVEELKDSGLRVRATRPRSGEDESEYTPEYFVPVLLKYRTKDGHKVKYPPKVYLVRGDEAPVLLDEDTVSVIDQIRVKNVNVVLNVYEYDPANGRSSLYVRTMYVEQDVDDDPYAQRYRKHKAVEEEEEEELPF